MFIKTLNGRVIVIVTNSTDTLEMMMKMIEDQEGIPPDQQKLVGVAGACNGRHLSHRNRAGDLSTVGDFNIVKVRIYYR